MLPPLLLPLELPLLAAPAPPVHTIISTLPLASPDLTHLFNDKFGTLRIYSPHQYLIPAKSHEKRTLLGNLFRLDSLREFLLRYGSEFFHSTVELLIYLSKRKMCDRHVLKLDIEFPRTCKQVLPNA